MKQYQELLTEILSYGEARTDRTGVGTVGIFGGKMRFNLHRFPLVTTKKVHFRSVVEELLWFLRGETNVKTLKARIWDEWADENGDLGPIYGKNWRDWDGIDQISELISNLKSNPLSRRHVISAWNVPRLKEMALPPCHLLAQFHVSASHTQRLSCQMYQRSADMFLGVPFNIASYALLTHILAYLTGYEVGELIWVGGDCHIYANHFDQVREQLTRKPLPLPVMRLKPDGDRGIDNWKFEDFQLLEYNSWPAIKGDVAV